MQQIVKVCACFLTGALVAACSNDHTRTVMTAPVAISRASDGSAQGAPFTEGLASSRWQELARDTLGPPHKLASVENGRIFAYLGLAEYAAVVAVDDQDPLAVESDNAPAGQGIGSGGRTRLDMERGAIGGAAAAVLKSLFPSAVENALIDARFTAEENAGPGPSRDAFTTGAAIGRQSAEPVIARAKNDHFYDVTTRVEPSGPGHWVSETSQPPVLPQVADATPFFLSKGSDFRPGPPPAFGSAEYLDSLQAIERIADTRTAEQIRIANFWNGGGPANFYVIASQMIDRYGLSEREAAHVIALMNMAVMDAEIGCWDAKYTYWFIRPPQASRLTNLGIPADPIKTVFAVPNHPSYPSAHSCIAASSAEALESFSVFSSERAALDSMVHEAGLSRMYAGIHYGFDIQAGQELGRSVAKVAIHADSTRGVLSVLP